MISVKGKCAADGNYYIDTAVEYYNPDAPGEAPGQWMDTAAARALRLDGKVQKAVFLNACNGYAADGVTKLRQNAGKKNAQAFTDLCASDPKGLSVFEAIADNKTRAVIAECREKALAKVVEALEARAVARLGKAGKDGHISGSVVVAGFRHVTSRAQDVQSHTHLVLLSQILCADGKWRAIDWKPTLYEKGVKKMLGAIYRTEMAYQLQSRLGLQIERLPGAKSQDTSLYDLSVMQKRFKPLLDELSKRRDQVLKLLAKKGESYDARAAAKATLDSRPAKRGHLSEKAVREATLQSARRHGLDAELVPQILGGAGRLPLNQKRAFAEILRHAVANLTKEQAHFTKVQIEQAVLEAAVGRGLPASVVQKKLQAALANARGPFQQIGPDRFTTGAVLKEEKEMFRLLDQLRASETHQCNPVHVERAIKSNADLSNEQVAALRVLTSPQGLILVDGYAGTGKSSVLREAKICWSGFDVIGTAVSGKAAEGLEKATGIKSYTLAKLIGASELGFRGDLEKGALDTAKHHFRMLGRAALNKHTWKQAPRVRLGPRSIVVVDEAGMLSTPDLVKLALACQRAGAKLVLVGDSQQLGALGRGGPFREACEHYTSVTLTTIVRQEANWHRRAAKLLSAGRSERALHEFARRGLVDVAKDRRQAVNHLVTAYIQGDLRDVTDRLVVASKNADVNMINRKIQQARRQAGCLGHPVCVNSQILFENDRVLFRQNSRELGVRNGSFGTLERFDERNQIAFVRLDGERRAKTPGKVVQVDLRVYKDLTLGYCSSIFRAQGVTQDKVLVLGDQLDKESGYVALTRSRGETRIFLSQEAAGEKLATFAKSLKTDNAKTLATSHLQESQSLALKKTL